MQSRIEDQNIYNSSMSNNTEGAQATDNKQANPPAEHDQDEEDFPQEAAKTAATTPQYTEEEEDARRKQLEDRIPIRHFEFTNQELQEIDEGIQKRFRKEGALEKLVQKRKRDAEAIASAGQDLVDTDDEEG